MASATIAGRDFGATSLIDAGVVGSQSGPGSVVDEPVVFRTAGTELVALLEHGLLPSPIVTLTGPGGTPVYCQGTGASCVGLPHTCPAAMPTDFCDYWLANAAGGLLQANAAGPIPADTTLYASYSFIDRLLEINVGITFPSGQFLTMTVFNVPAQETGPVDIPLVAASPPAAPFPQAFDALLQTNLTTSGNRELFITIDDPANMLTLSQLDLANEGNPCLAGSVNVLMISDTDPTPVTLVATFETPGC